MNNLRTTYAPIDVCAKHSSTLPLPAIDGQLISSSSQQQVAFYVMHADVPVKRSHLSMFMAYKAFIKEGAARSWQIVKADPFYNCI